MASRADPPIHLDQARMRRQMRQQGGFPQEAGSDEGVMRVQRCMLQGMLQNQFDLIGQQLLYMLYRHCEMTYIFTLRVNHLVDRRKLALAQQTAGGR